MPAPLTSGAPVQVQLKTVACQEALVSRAAVGHAYCLCFQHSTKSSAENGQALRQVVVAAVAQPALLPCYSMDETCQVRQMVAADHQEAVVARPHLEEVEAPRLAEAVVRLARAVSPCRRLVHLQAVAEHLQVSGRRSWSAERRHQRYPVLAAAMCLAVSYQVVACACFGQLALHPELAAAAEAPLPCCCCTSVVGPCTTHNDDNSWLHRARGWQQRRQQHLVRRQHPCLKDEESGGRRRRAEKSEAA